MAKPKFVTIEKDDQVGQCLPQSVKVWVRNGWTVRDDGDSETDPETVAVEPGTTTALEDDGQQTDEVNAQLFTDYKE